MDIQYSGDRGGLEEIPVGDLAVGDLRDTIRAMFVGFRSLPVSSLDNPLPDR